jgi:hypothetical protein
VGSSSRSGDVASGADRNHQPFLRVSRREPPGIGRHDRAALLVPAGGPPGQPVVLHGSAGHQHACKHGQLPAVGEPAPAGRPAA